MTDFHSFMPERLRGLLKKLIWEFHDASHGFRSEEAKWPPLTRTLTPCGIFRAMAVLALGVCPWCAIHQYFNRLSTAGFFVFLQNRMIIGDTSEAVFMDSIHCKVHQHANGCGNAKDKAIGKSRSGLNSKIHIVVDALGKLAAPVELSLGNVSDMTVVPRLLENLQSTAVVDDSWSEVETGEVNRPKINCLIQNSREADPLASPRRSINLRQGLTILPKGTKHKVIPPRPILRTFAGRQLAQKNQKFLLR